LQIPTPDNPFPGYLLYDPDDEMVLFINNFGIDGIYFVYQGTRITFGDGTDSFASHIHFVNGTTAAYAVDTDSDSIYIPAGDTAELYFYANPTDHPCQAAGQSCQDANIIPDKQYKVNAWINGYSDQGESFSRSVFLGNVVVEDT